MIQASRYYKMYWIWIIFTNLNEYLLDRGLGLGAKGTDCINNLHEWVYSKYVPAINKLLYDIISPLYNQNNILTFLSQKVASVRDA